MLQPSRPRPTTHMPITEPPEKAMDRALIMPLSMAALAVRTLALVATFMPKKPASMEKPAPMTKQMPVPILMNREISAKRMAMKMTSILYSERRKALAPSAMEPAISCIRALPAAEEET